MSEEADLEAALAEEFMMEAAEGSAAKNSATKTEGESALAMGSRLYDILNWYVRTRRLNFGLFWSWAD